MKEGAFELETHFKVFHNESGRLALTVGADRDGLELIEINKPEDNVTLLVTKAEGRLLARALMELFEK